MRRASLGAVICTAVAALSTGPAASARAAVNAPGFDSGPEIVAGGLLWWGENGVSLSGAAGTRLLVPLGPDAWTTTVQVNAGWTVVAERKRLELGRIGARLAPVRALRHCRAGVPESWHVALSEGALYTIVRAGCLGRRSRQAQFLVRIRLATGALHVIARVRSGAVSLVAAGGRLALTYEVANVQRNRVEVEILDASNARALYRVSAPASDHAPERDVHTQLDAAGEVLVQGSTGPVSCDCSFAWWGGPATPIGRALAVNSEASLSQGRIAYATSQGGVEHIDLLNLKTQKTRTMVAFPGSARIEGVGLGDGRLAWAQRSYGYTTATKAHACVESTPVGYTELLEMPLSAPFNPIVVHGIAVPPAAGPICVRPLAR
jgi:hypothetical protein